MLNRSVKPEPTGKILLNIPNIQSFKLNNGLEVFFVKKNTLPIIQINLITASGSIYDGENKNGLASLTSMMIDEGAGDLSGLEISNEIEMLGSILDLNVNKEFSTISLLSLKENINKSLEILSLIVQSPTFADEDFEREKQKLLTKILQLNDDPSYLASSEFQNRVFHSSPFKFPTNGFTESVEKITDQEIKSFYQNQFLPQNSYLMVVGDLEQQEEVVKLCENYFACWSSNETIKKVNYNFLNTSKQIVIIDKPEAAQSEIRIGHISKKRTSEDFYSRSILNSILGGQFSSRINLNLREDKGYTYGAHSNYSYNTFASSFIVSTSVKTEFTGESVKEILFELERIKTSVSQEELDFSKSYLLRRYPSLFETYSQVASNISLLPIYGLDIDYFNNYMKNIKNVSLQNVIEAAEENIKMDDLVIVIVGNKNKIEDQLSNFQSFPVHIKNMT